MFYFSFNNKRTIYIFALLIIGWMACITGYVMACLERDWPSGAATNTLQFTCKMFQDVIKKIFSTKNNNFKTKYILLLLISY